MVATCETMFRKLRSSSIIFSRKRLLHQEEEAVIDCLVQAIAYRPTSTSLSNTIIAYLSCRYNGNNKHRSKGKETIQAVHKFHPWRCQSQLQIIILHRLH